MANKEMKTYKRSAERPLVVTEDHKKAIHAYELTSNIIKFALIGVVLLSLIFSMLALVKVEVKNDQLNEMIKDKATYANISAYDLIGGWSAKSTFTYAPRGVNSGYQYPNTLDYIIDNIPALNAAMLQYKDIAAKEIFNKVTPEQDKMLNSGYMTMLSLEIISLVWIAALAVIFALTFVKKMQPSQTIINASLIIHLILTSIMWIITLVLTANGTKDFVISVGVGMWLNMLVAVVAVFFVIFNFIYKTKVRMYEQNM